MESWINGEIESWTVRKVEGIRVESWIVGELKIEK